jgi:HPt (histidine-containing phosphotransfer) domain-containing protein
VTEPLAGGAAAYEDAFALLAERAHRRNLDRTARVLGLLAPAEGGPDGDGLDLVARAEAMRLCHAVAGSAGTFGEHGLGEAARRLESVLRDGSDADVAAALDALRAAAAGVR